MEVVDNDGTAEGWGSFSLSVECYLAKSLIGLGATQLPRCSSRRQCKSCQFSCEFAGLASDQSVELQRHATLSYKPSSLFLEIGMRLVV